MTSAFALGKHAKAECDKCGFTTPYRSLRHSVFNRSRTGSLVCPTCFDPDHPQTFLYEVDKTDPQALRNPRPEKNLDQQRADPSTPAQAAQLDAVLNKPYPWITP